MNEAYKKEIDDLVYKMNKAEDFAKKLPFLSKIILERKISGDDTWVKFSDKYKDLYLAWGLNRGLYETGTNRTVTNYTGKAYKEYLFNIYINTIEMYDSHEKFGLEEIQNSTPVFFFDCSNSTFYAKDEQIEDLLEALLAWYKIAISKIEEHRKQEEIERLKKKLEELTGE